VSRTPRFETHIRPMFRRIDRDHMRATLRPIDLWDYHQVASQACGILARLRQNMPPTESGGPWPPEWIGLFERWIDAGCPRLDLGEATYRVEPITSTVWTLTATVSNPGPGYAAWLERAWEPSSMHEFVLYREPAGGAGSAVFDVTEDFEDLGGAGAVVVHDASGTHRIPYP